jgi:hypothetical protein
MNIKAEILDFMAFPLGLAAELTRSGHTAAAAWRFGTRGSGAWLDRRLPTVHQPN